MGGEGSEGGAVVGEAPAGSAAISGNDGPAALEWAGVGVVGEYIGDAAMGTSRASTVLAASAGGLGLGTLADEALSKGALAARSAGSRLGAPCSRAPALSCADRSAKGAGGFASSRQPGAESIITSVAMARKTAERGWREVVARFRRFMATCTQS